MKKHQGRNKYNSIKNRQTLDGGLVQKCLLVYLLEFIMEYYTDYGHPMKA